MYLVHYVVWGYKTGHTMLNVVGLYHQREEAFWAALDELSDHHEAFVPPTQLPTTQEALTELLTRFDKDSVVWHFNDKELKFWFNSTCLHVIALSPNKSMSSKKSKNMQKVV